MENTTSERTSSATDDIGATPISTSVVVRIEKWDELMRLSRLMTFGDWAYRGQEDVAWKLTTSIEREENKRLAGSSDKTKSSGIVFLDEHDFLVRTMALPYGQDREFRAIETFRKLGPDNVKKMSRLEILALMQHYGANTRLLDFTLSMFVALFFAFENRCTKHDRVLYAVQLPKLFKTSPTIRTIIEKKAGENGYGHDCCSTEDEQNLLFDAREDLLCPMHREDTLADLANSRIGESCAEVCDVIPVFATGTNKRIVAQNGLFLMPLSFKPFVENLAAAMKMDVNDIGVAVDGEGNVISEIETFERLVNELHDVSLLKIILDKKGLELDAWDVLAQVNISPMSIYPDLVGLAKSMRY